MTTDRDWLADKLAREIEGWEHGHQLNASFANDGGGGRFDFMGFTVTKEGRAALRKVIEEAMGQMP
jgi:hypothetical protein